MQVDPHKSAGTSNGTSSGTHWWYLAYKSIANDIRFYNVQTNGTTLFRCIHCSKLFICIL